MIAHRRFRYPSMRLAVVPMAVLFAISVAQAQQDHATTISKIQGARVAMAKGLEYLKSQQKPDGGWQGDKQPPGITALVLRAFLADKKDYPADSELVRKGFEKLLSYQLEDGRIYKDSLASYNTAIAISALAAADDPKYKDRMDRAVAYLKGLQWNENTVASDGTKLTGSNDPWYGGWGYRSGGGRPDLSNTQMALEALRDAGLKPDDPAFQAAVKFITRNQNYSETNDQSWAGNDGGFIYSPGAKRTGESPAGDFTDSAGERRLRSYGSMTYAGLKSFIFAGLTRDDPRVKAAFAWITKNWTLDENPGMGAAKPENAKFGLYYYFHTMGRALNEYDSPTITDAGGKPHDWRAELIDKVLSLQHPDGSWAGDKRWMEDNPVLVTAYSVLTLEQAIKDLEEHPATASAE